MLLPYVIFLGFTQWTLFHWQDLPALLKDEAAGEKWPLSIHHTSTPLRMCVVATLYAVFSATLLYLSHAVVQTVLISDGALWLTLGLLIGAHFTPYLSSLCSYVRYYFQRQLFFPSLPSHQEDHIIKTLMTKASQQPSMQAEIEQLHGLLNKDFSRGIHAFNLLGLREEHQLVEREFKQLRHRGVLGGATREPDQRENEQLLRFHLYSCYRLLTRRTLASIWSGRDRRQAFRSMGYAVNASDGDIYARARRLRYIISNVFTHNRPKKNRHLN